MSQEIVRTKVNFTFNKTCITDKIFGKEQLNTTLAMVYFDTLGSLGNGSKVTDKGNLKTDINGSRDGPSIGDQTIQAALQFGVLVR